MIKNFDDFIIESRVPGYSIHAHLSNNSNPNNITQKKISFTKRGFEEFNELIKDSKNDYKKLLDLIKDMMRNPDFYKPGFAGIGGKTQQLFNKDGLYSKRISEKHRLEYKITSDEVVIYSCMNHYDDK